MSKHQSPSEALNERIRRYPSVERLVLLRNLAYGAAAVCLAVLVGLTQVGAKELSLRISVFAAVVALPLWLAIGGAIEYYVFLGSSSYPHFRNAAKGFSAGLVALVAGSALIVTVVGVICFLLPAAAWLFGGSCVVACFLYWRFHVGLANWLSQSAAVEPPRVPPDA